MSADPSTAFYAWKHYHPREAEDPQAIWAAAWKAGGRAALQNSGRLMELVPLLRDTLYLLEDGAIEDEVRASDRRPQAQLFEEPEYQYEVRW